MILYNRYFYNVTFLAFAYLINIVTKKLKAISYYNTKLGLIKIVPFLLEKELIKLEIESGY